MSAARPNAASRQPAALTAPPKSSGWLTSVPAHVPDELIRYYVYWRIFYVLAGIAHFFSLVMFWQAGVTFMAFFNVFSVAIFIAASFLLRAGFYRVAYWGAISELVLHGVAATVCTGLQYGFQNYAFLVTILVFIQPFYSWRISIVLAAFVMASAGVVTGYALNNPPIYTVTEQLAESMIITSVVTWPLYVLVMVLPFVRASERAEKDLAAAYGESESLLLNILPQPIARRLKSTAGMIADDHDRVAILFADIVGFTSMSGRLPPAQVVTVLNEVFNAIDELVAGYGVEKIKTIGDAYMVVAGLPEPVADPDETIANLALDIQAVAARFKQPGSEIPVQLRIGLNAGAVVAGVIGNRKFAYDLWGDAVNVAARMESSGEPGSIHVTDAFAEGLRDRFTFEPRGKIDIKGKGEVATSFLTGRLVMRRQTA